MIRASFVIPAYNMERWISKTIYSCRKQTISQVEIIVVNDGSSDETKDIIDWHAKEDPRVIPVHLEQNVGRSQARNIGNDRASSPLILVLDADDMATRNRVKDTLTTFQLKKPDFLYGSFFEVDSMGNVGSQVIRCMEFDPELSKIKKLNYICHSTVAYTKTVSKDVRYESGEFARLGLDDWKFQWEVYQKGFTIRNIRNPLCYYRVTDDNISSTRNLEEVEKVKDEYLVNVY